MNNSLSVLRSHPTSLSAFDPCGIEVSQHTLVVALRAGDPDPPLREFPNTPPGGAYVPLFGMYANSPPSRHCDAGTPEL